MTKIVISRRHIIQNKCSTRIRTAPGAGRVPLQSHRVSRVTTADKDLSRVVWFAKKGPKGRQMSRNILTIVFQGFRNVSCGVNCIFFFLKNRKAVAVIIVPKTSHGFVSFLQFLSKMRSVEWKSWKKNTILSSPRSWQWWNIFFSKQRNVADFVDAHRI